MIYLYVGIAILVIGSAAYLIYRKRLVPPSQSSESGTSEPAPESEVAETVPEKGASKITPLRPAAPATEKATYPIAEYSTLAEDAKLTLMNAVWYRCENPYCNHTEFLDVHHIVDDGSNALDNLIVLCPRCNAAAHNNEITKEELQSWLVERAKRFKTDLDWPYK